MQWMFRASLNCFLISLAFCASVLAGSTPETIRAPAPGNSHKFGSIERPTEIPEFAPADLKLTVGEKLIYEIRVSGVPAGKTCLEVRKTESIGNGKEAWVVGLETRSNRAASFMYDVRDQARAQIDVKGGFSRSFSINIKEGDMQTREEIEFKYDIGDMMATYMRPRSDGEWRTHKIPLTGKVLDPLSAIYYLRALDLKTAKNGELLYLPICTDRRVWNTRLKITERRIAEDVGELKGREVVCIVPDAEFKGLFERKGPMKIWVDVATGIPLRMTCEIPIGPAEVILSEFSNSPLNK